MQTQSIKLLQSQRFFPLFVTQFLEAFNDNLFKNAMAVLITYSMTQTAQNAEILVALAGAIFILPFFLFSAMAGQLADKFNKTTIIRIVKVIEIIAMIMGAVGLYAHNIPLLMVTLFIIGAHSSFFSPIKFSILPDHLYKNELISGNALIQSSTFIAILLGTIVGSAFIIGTGGIFLISGLGIAFACFGLLMSFFIPATIPAHPQLKISGNIFKQSFQIVKNAAIDKRIFLSILGISWLWLIGIIFVTLFPTLTKYILHADNQMVTIFLAMFSIGIGIGSFISEQIQKGEINARYVPIGILGMTVFTIDLYFNSYPASTLSSPNHLLTVSAFLSYWHSWHIIIDTFFIAVFGGIFVVPLYTMLQHFSKKENRSRNIAANNIMNALFMVCATLTISLVSSLNISVTTLFLFIGLINLVITLYVIKLLPNEFVKLFFRTLLKLLYRVKVEGLDNYLQSNPRSLIVANHVSFLDGLLLSAFLPDNVIFAINTEMANKWWFKPALKLVSAFPIDPHNPMVLKSLIRKIKDDHRCFIFPEGRLTVTGGLMKIYEGPGMIADKAQADIIPVRIDGAQYSFFSRLKQKVRTRWFPKITIHILPARKFHVDPKIKGRKRRELINLKLYDVMTDLIFESSPYQSTLLQAVIDAKKVHGSSRIILEDLKRTPFNYRKLLLSSFALGSYLKKHHPPKETVIGVLLPSAAAAVVCLFGIQLSGRTPAFLNVTTGKMNLLHACQTAIIKTVYTSHNFIEKAKLEDVVEYLQHNGIQFVFLEEVKKRMPLPFKLSAKFKSYFPEWGYKTSASKKHPEAAAVILFTSGSEAAPKAVVLSHKNILANCYQISARVAFNPQDVVLNVLPIFHAFGLTAGTILPLIFGNKVFLYPSPLHYRLIPELAYDINASIFFGTDTFLAAYGKYAHPYDFYNARYVFAGAEKVKTETKQLWFNKFGIRILEGYGATETSPVISVNTPMHYKSASVGRLMPGLAYQIKTLSEFHEGGELLVKGPTIMKGYMFLNRPGILVPPHDGWYATGDIVTIDHENFVYVKDRLKRFAKIAGEMVSLSGIEHSIAEAFPNCCHAVVTLPDPKKGEKIILVSEDKNVTKEKIRKYFHRHHVSNLCLPNQVIFIEKMFLLGTGKTDLVKVKAYAEKYCRH